MMHPRHLRIEDFTYDLPNEKIADFPKQNRDESRLLVYKEGAISQYQYKDIAELLPADAMMFFNQTKVVHARLNFFKETGSRIEVFCLEPDSRYKDIQTAMTTRGEVYWRCMVGGAGKWKPGLVLRLRSEEGGFTLAAKVAEKNSDSFLINLSWDNPALSFAEVLHYAGKVPLPPYIRRTASAIDEDSYQTIYAKDEGSVAAPTAGLHFTDRVMAALRQKGIATAFLTLHVGAGTFKPVKAETMDGHEMHAEWIDVSLETIENLLLAMTNGKPVIAVGTTSMRTLESLYWIGVGIIHGNYPVVDSIAVSQWMPYEQVWIDMPQAALQSLLRYMRVQQLDRLVTRTQIILAPGYQFRIVKGLVTNFHQPQSTLLLLVAALIGEDWKTVYQYALNEDFRFLSYGDGCLLFP